MFEVTPKRIAAMRRALVRLSAAETRAVSLSFLDRTEVEGLRGMAAMQSFRTATPSIEYRGNSVRQDFDVCFPAPREGVFDGLATCLETVIAEACAAMRPPPFNDRLQLNDFAIQRYPKDSRGIGIHRDGKRYRASSPSSRLKGVRACSPAMTVRAGTRAPSTTGPGALSFCPQPGSPAARRKMRVRFMVSTASPAGVCPWFPVSSAVRGIATRFRLRESLFLGSI